MRDNTSEEVERKVSAGHTRRNGQDEDEEGLLSTHEEGKGRRAKTQLKEKGATTTTQEAKKNLKTGVRSTKLTGNNQILNLDGKGEKSSPNKRQRDRTGKTLEVQDQPRAGDRSTKLTGNTNPEKDPRLLRVVEAERPDGRALEVEDQPRRPTKARASEDSKRRI